MSLHPNDRRVLAGIEDALASSDPRLAARLATLTLPFTARVLVRIHRFVWSRWATRLAVAAVAAAVVSLVVVGWLMLSPSRVPSCAGLRTGVSGSGQVTACRSPGGRAPSFANQGKESP